MEDARWHPRPNDAVSPAPDRVAHRHKTFEPVILVTAAGELRAHILNLSATGALVHAVDGPVRGARCTVRLAEREVAGQVVWVDGPRFGIAFRGALTSDDLARLLG